MEKKKKKKFLFLNTIPKIPFLQSQKRPQDFWNKKNSQNQTFDLKVWVKNKPKTSISANDLFFCRHYAQFNSHFQCTLITEFFSVYHHLFKFVSLIGASIYHSVQFFYTAIA